MSLLAKIPYQKPPKNFNEQVDILLSRGILVPDRCKAKFYLSQLNYYRLAAYCLPFELASSATPHQVIKGTTFDDILNLYIFDRELRLLMLDAIERIEVSLRTQMAYQMSHRHNTAHPHLRADLFKNEQRYESGIRNLEKAVNNNQEDFIRHLRTKYAEQLPPIWAIVELMSIGELSKWFANIKLRRDRQAISEAYNINEGIMTSFCTHLSLVRNFSAHHARLWNRNFTITMKLPKNCEESLMRSLHVLPQSDKALRKIYNTLTMIIYLMNIIAPNHHWLTRLKSLIEQHAVSVSHMGFPHDWKELNLWRYCSNSTVLI